MVLKLFFYHGLKRFVAGVSAPVSPVVYRTQILLVPFSCGSTLEIVPRSQTVSSFPLAWFGT